MKIELKNRYVLGLASWLNVLRLPGEESRERVRFVEDLSAQFKVIEEKRIALVEKYADKNEDGSVKEEDGHAVIPNLQGFTDELTKLYDEVYTKEFTKKSFETLKHIIVDTDYVFGVDKKTPESERFALIRQANDYNEWCKAFGA